MTREKRVALWLKKKEREAIRNNERIKAKIRDISLAFWLLLIPSYVKKYILEETGQSGVYPSKCSEKPNLE